MRNVVAGIIVLFGTVFQAQASDTLTYNIKRHGNWAFYGTDKPVAMVTLVNGRQIGVGFNLSCSVSNWQGKPLYELNQRGKVLARDSSSLSFSFKAMDPGFYNVRFSNNGVVVGGMNISYEPDRIGYDTLEDDTGKGDFLHLAHLVALQRRDMNPQFSMLRNKDLSGSEKNVYNFSMVSRCDEKIMGYVAFPKGKKGLPMIVTLVAGESRSVNPLGDFTAPADCAELVVYVNRRGEGEDQLKNLLTDMLLAIDFAAQRVEIDKNSIYVQGEGYLAACAFVAGALYEGVAASFASSPDFSLLTEDYSIKSIAANVTSPILMGLGLQKDTRVLNESFSIYNKVYGVKEYFVDSSGEDIERGRWKYMRDIFMIRLKD